MSDRYIGFVVTLENPIKDDIAKHLLDAIAMLKGVVDVKPLIEDPMHEATKNMARAELINKLWEVLK